MPLQRFRRRHAGSPANRFGTFAVLPLPDVESACREAVRALDEADADGVVVLASYGDEFFGGAKFDPLLDVLNSRNAVVFVHPTQHPESKKLPLDLPLFVANIRSIQPGARST